MQIKSKKITVFNLIEILVISLLLIGASYAYLEAQIENNATSAVEIETKTVDQLTFNTGKNINIELNQDNMRPGMDDLKDETTASATLLANNVTNEASAYYNVFLIIETNEFNYTTENEESEIIVKLIDPANKEIKEIDGLNYVGEGFDITRREGSFLVAKNYYIAAQNMTTQDWQVVVTVKNLETSQEANVGKSFKAKIRIMTGDVETYTLAAVNESTLKTTESTITFTPDVIEGTEKVSEYYYGIEKASSSSIKKTSFGPMNANTVEYIKTTANSYTFKGLTDFTKYKIYCYVEDKEGFRSDVYETEATTSYIEPVAEKIALSNISSSSMTATINVKTGSTDIVNYYFKVNNAEYQRLLSNVYTFDVNATSNYTVEGYAVDKEGHETKKLVVGYINPKADKVEITEIPNGNSIIVKTTASKGTANIKAYYFKLDEDDWQKVESTADNASFTFENVDKNKEFKITTYIEDENGRQSNEVQTDANQVTIYFDGNGNIVEKRSESCFIKKGENNCQITTPGITADQKTPEVIGYSLSALDHEKVVGANEELTVSASDNGKTYFAQSKNSPITHTISYKKQGNGVTDIGKESDNCIRVATYNGEKQAASCTVLAPSISVSTGYTAVGWSTMATSHEGTGVNQNITLTGNATYYSISYKNAITYSVTYNANNNTIAATSGTCTIPAAYNTDPQATECPVDGISINSSGKAAKCPSSYKTYD